MECITITVKPSESKVNYMQTIPLEIHPKHRSLSFKTNLEKLHFTTYIKIKPKNKIQNLMFIINITYKSKLQKIDQYLNEHIKFLNEQYELGNFLVSGRKTPRTGGIILSKIHMQSELEKIIKKDPFKIHELADYELIEFIPSKTCEELKFLIE